MADNLDKNRRSWNMSRIRSEDTVPELKVFRALRRGGYKVRRHDKTLPGIPDFAISGIKTVIFVNGCFWHRHICSRATTPKSNKTYWTIKFANNVKRMRHNQKALNRLGWRVRTIWECQIKKTANLSEYIKRILK